MSLSKELFRLRKSKEYEKALDVIGGLDKEELEDVWTQRAIAWIYYDKAKFCEDDQLLRHSFHKKLVHLSNLLEDELLTTQVQWLISKEINVVSAVNVEDYLRDTVMQLNYRVIDDSYRMILIRVKQAFKSGKMVIEAQIQLDFYHWWDFSHFQSRDFEKQESNGRRYPSLAESTLTAWAQLVYTHHEKANVFLSEDGFSQDRNIDKDFNMLEVQHRKNPEFHYLTYYTAKLAQLCGKSKKAVDLLIGFMKENHSFWVFDLLADWTENLNERIVLLAKAFWTGRHQEAMIVKVIEKFSKEAEIQKKDQLASYLIDKVVEIREAHGWNVKEYIYRKKHELPDIQMVDKKKVEDDIKAISNKWAFTSVFEGHIAQEKAVVTRLFKDRRGKKMCTFTVRSDDASEAFRSGITEEKNINGDVKKGSWMNVISWKDQKDNPLFVHVNNTAGCDELVKEVRGTLTVHDAGFGFVDEVFVAKSVIQKKGVKSGDVVQVMAIKSFNMKRNEWGWSAAGIRGKHIKA